MVRWCRRASLGDGHARGWSADRDFMRGKIRVILDVFSVSTATGVGKVAASCGGAAGGGFAGGGRLCYRYA
jgi:hypothetical protein